MVRFEGILSAEVDAGAASVRAASSVADEVKQRLRASLLVGDGERGPALADYAARGDLRGFLRVSAVRECLRIARRAQREVGLDEDALVDLAPAMDPELERLKERYRQEFTASFIEAVKALPPRERTLLRHQAIDRLSIDQIGQIYGVHRATAARRLERARARVAELTEARLAERLSLGTEEVASVIRLVRSQLDVTLERLLDDDH
jgi:RNA polymerase sigma-70 factor (ECF subfamily)